MRICMSEWMNWHLFECMQRMDRLDWRGHPQGILLVLNILVQLTPKAISVLAH